MLFVVWCLGLFILGTSACPDGFKEVPGSFCGGIAGFPCPKKEQICNLNGIPGQSDPGGVCCELAKDRCPKNFQEVPSSFCGGIAGIPCKGGNQICQIDNVPGGADFGGVCCEPRNRCPKDFQEVPNSFCGGIAGIPCTGEDQICQLDDVPGGADIGGVCCEPKGDSPKFCSLPPDAGPCEAAIPRWFFNHKNGVCAQFIYGGCEGNRNRFTSKDECESQCVKDSSICTLPPETGPCKAAIPRWFFNHKKSVCDQFIYGGCGGNGNRFISKDSCEAQCSSNIDPVDVCNLQPEVGPCRAAFERWFFNGALGKCETFTYGGCDGNGNRFESREACQERCSSQASLCLLDKETGPCRARFPRWYFDNASGDCKMFIYGGCRGNANRFTTKEACLRKCKE